MRDGGKSFAELVEADTVLVNTNDGTVKRLEWEHLCNNRAVARAYDQYIQLKASYDAMFANRVGQILKDPEVTLPPLPPQFLGIGDTSA